MLFFTPNINRAVEGEYTNHFFSMRVKKGDIVKISDLKGNFAITRLDDLDKKSLKITHTLQKKFNSSSFKQKILFQAITDKIYLEKIMEIAPIAKITDIWLFFGDYSIQKNIPIARLEQILVRSCCQSETVRMPKIKVLNKPELEKAIVEYKPIVLEETADNSKFIKDELVSVKNTNEVESILVGPEGGWSEAEKLGFEQNKLDYFSLGETVFPAWLAGYSYFVSKL